MDYGNLISGNGDNGIACTGNGVRTYIAGNIIGTNLAGTVSLANQESGILLNTAGNSVGGVNGYNSEGNLISGNNQHGVGISGSNNLIASNYIGTKLDGSAAVGNGWDGVFLTGTSAGNTIGGSGTTAGNIISGNGRSGVELTGQNVSGNSILGNWIGLGSDGATAVPNRNDGVLIHGSAFQNTVGAAIAQNGPASNVISGNTNNGIEIADAGTVQNVVIGDYIGTNSAGTNYVGNNNGIYISSSRNTIGGTQAGSGNVISGNNYAGIDLNGGGSNVILANFIGTDKNGTAEVTDDDFGIKVENGANSNTIGGTATNARNVISGNGFGAGQPPNFGFGIFVQGSQGTTIQGNYIGVAQNGNPLGNRNDGIYLVSADNTMIGGAAAGAGNVISANGWSQNPDGTWQAIGWGISINGTNNASVLGNLVGVTVGGQQDANFANALGWLSDGGQNTQLNNNTHQ